MCPCNCFGFFSRAEPPQKPFNYRETPFDFGLKRKVMVAGLASPRSYGQDPIMAMKYLKKHKITTIFALHALRELKTIADSLGMNYVDVSIPDFEAPAIELFDDICNEVIAQAKNKKKIAIHCMGGIGRTGTVLAAIKLKELSNSESFFDHNCEIDSFIESPYSSRPFKCTANVRHAIQAIRKIPGSEDAVESEVQVHSLCYYERLLRSQHAQIQLEKANGM